MRNGGTSPTRDTSHWTIIRKEKHYLPRNAKKCLINIHGGKSGPLAHHTLAGCEALQYWYIMSNGSNRSQTRKYDPFFHSTRVLLWAASAADERPFHPIPAGRTICPLSSIVAVAKATAQFSTLLELAMRIRRRFKPSGVCVTRGVFACCLLVAYLPRCGRRATGPWAAMRCPSVVASLEHKHGTRFVGFRRWLPFAGRVPCGFSDRAIPILNDPGWCLEKIFI